MLSRNSDSAAASIGRATGIGKFNRRLPCYGSDDDRDDGNASSVAARAQDPLPPRQITDNAAARAGVDLGDEDTRNAATMGAHFAYGASVGAMYGPIAGSTKPAVRCRRNALRDRSMGWKLSWAASRAGLYRSADDEPAPRNAMIIAAHLIWGASLGVMTEALADKN